jgi:L-seryl-tRNA(Ser) seleniumtransferase
VNATGIVLHTGLGRAPLAAEAVEAVTAVAAGYCNLELDLASGERGDRHAHVRELLRELTGAEDALVVNNNAAATFLALHALAAGREVIVSRGELVEIGGSYRMPDIMAAAGCRMVEVGTTNRTRIGDYRAALRPETAVLLRVHTSNYRICGFTESAGLAELAALAAGRPEPPLYAVDDLGSGLLDYEFQAALPAAMRLRWDEPTVRESVRAGAALTLFSGDKLLGGPQAGVIVGRSELIARLRRSPLNRALRPDKLTLAALEATLRLQRDPAALVRRLPVLRLLSAPADELARRAARLAEALEQLGAGLEVQAAADQSYAGGGSLPTLAFPTHVVRVRAAAVASAALAAGLRGRDVPVIARVQDERLVLDCRTIADEEVELVAAGVREVLREGH